MLKWWVLSIAGAALTAAPFFGVPWSIVATAQSSCPNNIVDAAGGVSCSADGGGNTRSSRYPGLSPLPYGAKGDGTTDDTGAINRALEAAALGGLVRLPPGHYCIKTASGIALSRAGQTLECDNRQAATFLDACGADNNIVVMSGFNTHLRGCQIAGAQNPTTVNAAIRIAPGAVEAELVDNLAVGGSVVVLAEEADFTIEHNKFFDAFGPAVILAKSGGYIRNNKIDQSYPVSTPSPVSIAAPSAWTASHAYSSGILVTVARGRFILQASNNGTSGTTEPAVPSYGGSTTDNGIVWKLAAPNTYYGVQVDTGAAAVQIIGNDLSGAYDAPIGITNTASGVPPQAISMFDNISGQARTFAGVYGHDGNLYQIRGNRFTDCILTTCVGISLQNNFLGDAQISGNMVYNAAQGINIGAGRNVLVSGNSVCHAHNAILVGAAVSDFNVIGNSLGGCPGGFGHTTNGVNITAGASDHYYVTANIFTGVTGSTVIDGGTGLHKQVCDGSSC